MSINNYHLQNLKIWKLKIQLTLEQHGFELHGSTYAWIFQEMRTIALHDPWVIESVDVEPWIERATVKLHVDFPLCGQHP